jgi:voltage-gated potassium channel
LYSLQIPTRLNSNIAFTIREISENAKIITTADSPDSVDILGLAGSNMVLEPRKMIGEAFGRRTMGGNALSSEIGRFENLIIAEAPAMGTPLVGKTLAQLELRKKIGINVAGFWDHGDFIDARPDFVIQNSTVLVLIGTEESIDLYNEMFVIFRTNSHPVLILGSGRVGEYAASMLERRDIDFVFVEKDAANVSIPGKTIVGNAADLETLEKAGIKDAPSVIISTSSDDMNIYLTIYCRKLRPDIQIISRANSDTNISTLKRAGSDLIMSYPSLTANAVFNFMKQSKILMISEGFDIFSAKVPKSMIGKSLLNARIREETGCNVLAIKQENEIYTNPVPNHIFDHGTSLLMVGSREAETNFLKLFN